MRSLRLEGEAYFDVIHKDAKPFIVRTANTTTRDLGTAFAVTDYPGDRDAQVIVAEGEVAVLSARDTNASTLQLLKRGDLASVTASGAITRTRVTNLDRRLAWLRGGLAFDDVPLGEALKQVARWYDLDIYLADSSLASRRLIATIGNEPADDVLRLVALTLGLRVERAEGSRVVTFYPK
jgi:ferric-dicitrate binding protein FerR (iron transport regulator)